MFYLDFKFWNVNETEIRRDCGFPYYSDEHLGYLFIFIFSLFLQGLLFFGVLIGFLFTLLINPRESYLTFLSTGFPPFLFFFRLQPFLVFNDVSSISKIVLSMFRKDEY